MTVGGIKDARYYKMLPNFNGLKRKFSNISRRVSLFKIALVFIRLPIFIFHSFLFFTDILVKS